MHDLIKILYRPSGRPVTKPQTAIADIKTVDIIGEDGWVFSVKAIDGKLRLESDRALKIIPSAANAFTVEFDT